MNPLKPVLLLTTAVMVQDTGPVAVASRTNIPYAEAQPVVELLREDLLPVDLMGLTSVERATAWPGWVSRRDAAIRARLQGGDEDSIVNFLLYGTSFTDLPPTTPGELGQIPDLVARRTEDLIAAIQSPGVNERLHFVRAVIQRKALEPATTAGQREIRRYFSESLARVAKEMAVLDNNARTDGGDSLTHFRDRGLSSDTSMFAAFAVEQALAIINDQDLLEGGGIRRVAIIGPGLDFTDKHEGYDFYPLQTIQPFAVIDSLLRLGVATMGRLEVATFDLSPRVNLHLASARERARAGSAYAVHLPRPLGRPWRPNLIQYWAAFGDRIGEEVKSSAAPRVVGDVASRAVNVRPSIVLKVTPYDVNIVLQRDEIFSGAAAFDLVIATNVLTYYGPFEQSLALLNVVRMLRPGGLLLSNNAIFELPAIPLARVGATTVTYIDQPGAADRMVWHRRQERGR